MKIWSTLFNFFGFGQKELSPKEEYEELEVWINSKQYFDDCQQKAYQVAQKKDSLRPGQAHAYDGQILLDCIKVDSSLSRHQNTTLTEQFGDARYHAEVLLSGISTKLSEFSKFSVESTLSGDIALKTPAAEILMSKLDQAKKELHIFKGANALERDAETPERSNILYFMGAFAIAEIFANIIFLREAFEPPDGLFISLLVTLLNLIGAAWFGYQFREKNHIEPTRATAGRKNALYATLIVAFANASIAGFRWIAVPVANTEFWLESTLLFVFGCALGYAAFQKAYRLDDPYPDYGPLSRKVNQLDAEFQQLREEHAEFCQTSKTRALDAHKSLDRQISSSYSQFVEKLPEMSKAMEVWSKQRNALTQKNQLLQRVFKGIVVSNVDPELRYPQEIRELPTDEILETFKRDFVDFEALRSRLDQQVATLQSQVKSSRDELEKWFRSDEARAVFGWPNQ